MKRQNRLVKSGRGVLMNVIHRYPHYDNPKEREDMLQECYNNTQKNLARVRKQSKEDNHERNLCKTIHR